MRWGPHDQHPRKRETDQSSLAPSLSVCLVRTQQKGSRQAREGPPHNQTELAPALGPLASRLREMNFCRSASLRDCVPAARVDQDSEDTQVGLARKEGKCDPNKENFSDQKRLRNDREDGTSKDFTTDAVSMLRDLKESINMMRREQKI